MPKYPTLAAVTLAGMAMVSASAVRAQDMRDMVGAHTPQADGEMARRGFARVGMESGGDRDWTYWWNAQTRSCLTIVIARGRYDSITNTPPDDCRRRGDDGYAGGRPGGPGGPGWGGPGGPGNGRPDWGGGRPGGIPVFNARCPMGIEVRADRGGPVYINGKQARLTVQRRDYFEAQSNRITVSVSRTPDGSLSISYTGPRRANGVCRVMY